MGRSGISLRANQNAQMDKVRVGIIGMGEIGKYHAGYLLDGKVQRCELVAVCSTSPQKLAPYQAKGLKFSTAVKS